MKTECKQAKFEFHPLFQRKVKARFDGGCAREKGEKGEKGTVITKSPPVVLSLSYLQ